MAAKPETESERFVRRYRWLWPRAHPDVEMPVLTVINGAIRIEYPDTLRRVNVSVKDLRAMVETMEAILAARKTARAERARHRASYRKETKVG